MKITVHPDVVKVADKVIQALEAVESDLVPGYHLEGTVVQIMIDDVPVATVEYLDDAWHLGQEVQ